MKCHKDLHAWQKAMELARNIYAVTKDFPADERFGLTNQLRRAVVSVPSNIAEGAARGGAVEFARFLHIALGSLAEVETQVELAHDLRYLSDSESLLVLVGEIRMLMIGLIRKLRDTSRSSSVMDECPNYSVTDSPVTRHPSLVTHHSSLVTYSP